MTPHPGPPTLLLVNGASAIYWRPTRGGDLTLRPSLMRLRTTEGGTMLVVGGMALGTSDPMGTLRRSAALSLRWGLPMRLIPPREGPGGQTEERLTRLAGLLAGEMDRLAGPERQAVMLRSRGSATWHAPDGGLRYWCAVLEGPGLERMDVPHTLVLFDPDPSGEVAGPGRLLHAVMLIGPWGLEGVSSSIGDMLASEPADSDLDLALHRP